jgi:hypothetical protein
VVTAGDSVVVVVGSGVGSVVRVVVGESGGCVVGGWVVEGSVVGGVVA